LGLRRQSSHFLAGQLRRCVRRGSPGRLRAADSRCCLDVSDELGRSMPVRVVFQDSLPSASTELCGGLRIVEKLRVSLYGIAFIANEACFLLGLVSVFALLGGLRSVG